MISMIFIDGYDYLHLPSTSQAGFLGFFFGVCAILIFSFSEVLSGFFCLRFVSFVFVCLFFLMALTVYLSTTRYVTSADYKLTFSSGISFQQSLDPAGQALIPAGNCGSPAAEHPVVRTFPPVHNISRPTGAFPPPHLPLNTKLSTL